MRLISFILPIYNEEKNISLLFSEIIKIKNQIEENVEILFINDGSNDNSYELLSDLALRYHFVKVINLSRNFGHQIAITAGLDFVSGDVAIIMDSDLQDPPEVSIQLIEKWKEGNDIVYAKRRTRKDTIFKKFTAYLYYRILKIATNIEIPEDTGDFRLIDRKVVNEIKKFREKSRYMRGLFSFVGFKQSFVLFDRRERHSGETNYPFKKMFKFAVDGITGFSTVPLRFISYLGLFFAFFSAIYIIYIIYMKYFHSELMVSGWTMIIVSIFFIGGIQMIMLGIIGEYIGRIYTETQNRPLYVIKNKINFNNK